MRDSNIPKFLPDDILLFEALVKDLFPGVEILDPPINELNKEIAQSITQNKLQRVALF